MSAEKFYDNNYDPEKKGNLKPRQWVKDGKYLLPYKVWRRLAMKN